MVRSHQLNSSTVDGSQKGWYDRKEVTFRNLVISNLSQRWALPVAAVRALLKDTYALYAAHFCAL